MYKEFAKSLREHAEWDKAGIWVIPNTIILDLIKAANAIESLDDIAQTYAEAVQELKMKSQWIPVTDRLPDEIEDVLIFGEWTGASGTKYREILLTDLKSLLHQGYKPIAWMPLPEPPKEE